MVIKLSNNQPLPTLVSVTCNFYGLFLGAAKHGIKVIFAASILVLLNKKTHFYVAFLLLN
jgi:hypothetical protein